MTDAYDYDSPLYDEEEVPEYYQKLNIPGVRNFDIPENFGAFERAVKDVRSRNFFIDFDDEEAWCAFDCDGEDYDNLLKNGRPEKLHTRWINIWVPYEQPDIVKVLARHFDFTPRLEGVMLSAPPKCTAKSIQTTMSTSSWFNRTFRNKRTPKATPDSSVDLEKRISPYAAKFKMNSVGDSMRGFNHWSMVNDIWHYSNADWGRKYVCLGYNSLHLVARHCQIGRGADDNPVPNRDLPAGKRIWTWLLLCEDKTVITIHEDPFPHRRATLDHHEQNNLNLIRRNLINVFRQCSKGRDSENDSAFMRLPIRHRLGDSHEETAHRPSDSPGLLFYCLFEDWISVYDIIGRREHRYAAELDKLRNEMLIKAELEHVDRLHHIGRQLAALKRLYQSYEVLIDRVLEKQEATLASLNNSHVVTGSRRLSSNSDTHMLDRGTPHIAESQSLLGVALSSPARARFERLKYRIRLYVLSELEECIDMKESLVMMNFNLIAIKESLSVERLTRITLLLAKVTILFMPVSLMTAYFSCQLKDVEFTLEAYWVAFTVIIVTSLFVLFGFSAVSGTMENFILPRSWMDAIVDVMKRIFGTRDERKEEMEEQMRSVI